MWIIAVPTSGKEGLDAIVHEDLEKAPYITLVKVENGKITNVETHQNEIEADTKSPQLIRRKKANIVICNKISSWSRAYLSVLGIEIIDGVKGKVREAVSMFVKGEISPIPRDLREEWGI